MKADELTEYNALPKLEKLFPNISILSDSFNSINFVLLLMLLFIMSESSPLFTLNPKLPKSKSLCSTLMIEFVELIKTLKEDMLLLSTLISLLLRILIPDSLTLVKYTV